MGSDPRQLLDPAMPLRESQPSEANSAEERQAASDSDEKIEFSADLNGLSRVLKPASQSLLDSVEEQRKRALIRRRLFGSRETEADADPVRIGRFVPLRRLGAGGMGVVYVAYDEQLRREVAVKLLHSTQEHGRSRLLSEARALARIAHPNIVTIYEVGESNQRVFIAMELVAGVTLREWLQRGPHSWREVVALFLQAGQGLWAVHQHGLVHRDFKPENLMVGDDGRVRMVDFGLARRMAVEPHQAERSQGDLPPPGPQINDLDTTSQLSLGGTEQEVFRDRR